MTLREQIEAASAKATGGVWTVCVYDAGDISHYDINGGCPSIQSESEDCAVVHWDGFKQEYWTSANGSQRQIEANADLIVTLVNAYRAGKLLVIEDEADAVRRMARVIADSLGDDYDMVPLDKGEWLKARGMCGGFPRDINAPFRLDYDDAATAALAALKGE